MHIIGMFLALGALEPSPIKAGLGGYIIEWWHLALKHCGV